MPFNVLLLPLLGGYILITNWNKTRFRTIRLDGQRLLLHSTIAGVFLLMASFFGARILNHFWPSLYEIWHASIPFEHSGTAMGAFLLGALLWYPGNLLFKRDKAIEETIKRGNDYLEIRLNRAVDDTRQMAITLKNGKTYIGFITNTFDPSFERKYIVILPTVSGYRDKETHELHLTTDYTSVYLPSIEAGDADVQVSLDETGADGDVSGRIPAEEFEIVIPVSEIISANFFDPEAYELFNASAEEERSDSDSLILRAGTTPAPNALKPDATHGMRDE